MITKTGYRQMLRDRTPKTVIYALKWRKTLEAWLDHVYKTRIWIYSDNKERLEETRRVLNLGKNKPFDFAGTIDWDNLTAQDKEHWENVQDWVSWFQQSYMYIENTYDVSKKVGKSVEEIKLRIIKDYLTSMCPTIEDSEEEKKRKNDYVNSFVDFLIKCFENRI